MKRIYSQNVDPASSLFSNREKTNETVQGVDGPEHYYAGLISGADLLSDPDETVDFVLERLRLDNDSGLREVYGPLNEAPIYINYAVNAWYESAEGDGWNEPKYDGGWAASADIDELILYKYHDGIEIDLKQYLHPEYIKSLEQQIETNFSERASSGTADNFSPNQNDIQVSDSDLDRAQDNWEGQFEQNI